MLNVCHFPGYLKINHKDKKGHWFQKNKMQSTDKEMHFLQILLSKDKMEILSRIHLGVARSCEELASDIFNGSITQLK